MKKVAGLGLVFFTILCLHIPAAALNVKLDGKVTERDWDKAEYIQFCEQTAAHIVFASAYYAVDTDGRTLYLAVQVCTSQPGAAPGKSAVELKLASGETIVMRTDHSSQEDYRYTLQYAAQWERDTDISLEAKLTLPPGSREALRQLQISYLDKNGVCAAVEHVSPALPEESASKLPQNNGISGSSTPNKAPVKEPEDKSTKFSFTGEIPSTRAVQSGQKGRTQTPSSEAERTQAPLDEDAAKQSGISGQAVQQENNRMKTLICAAAACVAVCAGGLILFPVLHQRQIQAQEHTDGEQQIDVDNGDIDVPPDKPDEF